MKLIWHIETKAVKEHHYYGSLTALLKKHQDVGISRSKITKDSRNLETWLFETETCIIRKGRVFSVSDCG